MRLHELLEHILLLLLVGSGLAHGLLSLVVHHLLHSLSSLAIQVTELAVLGLHLLRINGGIACNFKVRFISIQYEKSINNE